MECSMIYNAMVCMYYFRLYVLNSVLLYHYLYLYFTSIYVCMCLYVEMSPWARNTLKDWRPSLKKLGWAPHTSAICIHIIIYDYLHHRVILMVLKIGSESFCWSSRLGSFNWNVSRGHQRKLAGLLHITLLVCALCEHASVACQTEAVEHHW